MCKDLHLNMLGVFFLYVKMSICVCMYVYVCMFFLSSVSLIICFRIKRNSESSQL